MWKLQPWEAIQLGGPGEDCQVVVLCADFSAHVEVFKEKTRQEAEAAARIAWDKERRANDDPDYW